MCMGASRRPKPGGHYPRSVLADRPRAARGGAGEGGGGREGGSGWGKGGGHYPRSVLADRPRPALGGAGKGLGERQGGTAWAHIIRDDVKLHAGKCVAVARFMAHFPIGALSGA